MAHLPLLPQLFPSVRPYRINYAAPAEDATHNKLFPRNSAVNHERRLKNAPNKSNINLRRALLFYPGRKIDELFGAMRPVAR